MTELKTVRKINDACWEAAHGRGQYVFADEEWPVQMERVRVIHARTRKGVLEARRLATGMYVRVSRVYTD